MGALGGPGAGVEDALAGLGNARKPDHVRLQPKQAPKGVCRGRLAAAARFASCVAAQRTQAMAVLGAGWPETQHSGQCLRSRSRPA